MQYTRIMTLGLVVPMAALWLLFFQDALTIVARGGSGTVVSLALVLGLGFGLVAAACVTPVILGLFGLGTLVDRLLKRSISRSFPAQYLTALFCAGCIAYGLHPAHEIFVKHPLGAWLMTGYAFFPALLASGWIAQQWKRGSGYGWAAALAGGIALHQVNAHLYAGLYPELHSALTGVTALCFAGGFLLFLGQQPTQHAVRILIIMGLGGVGWFVGGSEGPARSAAAFSGTELKHGLSLMDDLLDGDGDGISSLAGDCNDGDPLVHPLRYEMPGNAVDENCGAGDATRGTRRIERTAHPPEALASWQAVHNELNVLVVFIDTLRADHIGALGGPPDLTPHLDTFFRQAVVFEQARSTAPRTPHAWMSIVRARFNGRNLRCRRSLMNPGKNTLPHRMQAAGYRTAARFVGDSWKRYHLAGGFDTLTTRRQINGISGPSVTRDTLRLMRGDAPFFVVAHYADPHAPYKRHPGQPEPADMKAAYAGEVKATDAQFGKLMAGLKKRGVLDKTLVVVFADHGENLGDHGDAGGHHGVSLFDEVIKVPMAIAGPGIDAARITDPVSVIDIAPTLLELIKQPPLPDPDGRSLSGYLFGSPPAPSYTISDFYDFDHRLRSITMGDHKLIVDAQHGASLLFNIRTDPGEQTDLTDAQPKIAAALKLALNQWVDDWADPADRGGPTCKKLVPGVAAKKKQHKPKPKKPKPKKPKPKKPKKN